MTSGARSEAKAKVADLLKRSRRGALLTQAQMAEALGVSSRTIIEWEKGTAAEPPTTVVFEWLRLTDRPISDLVKLCAPWDLNPEPADYWSVAEWALAATA